MARTGKSLGSSGPTWAGMGSPELDPAELSVPWLGSARHGRARPLSAGAGLAGFSAARVDSTGIVPVGPEKAGLSRSRPWRARLGFGRPQPGLAGPWRDRLRWSWLDPARPGPTGNCRAGYGQDRPRRHRARLSLFGAGRKKLKSAGDVRAGPGPADLGSASLGGAQLVRTRMGWARLAGVGPDEFGLAG